MGKTVFVDLTHPFSAEIPRWPYFDKPVIDNTHTMAKGGVLTQKITCTMHTGTHCDAPRHVMEYEFDGRRFMATYHPSALLRDVSKRPEAFMDLRSLRKEIRAVCDSVYL